jgi:minichromosome maintenance protein 10
LDNGGGGATYVVGGNVLNTRTEGGLRHHGDEYLGEKIGRRGAEKRKRKADEREAEESLKRLLDRDGAAQSTGGRYLAQMGVEIGKDGSKGKGNGKKGEEEDEIVKRAFSAKQIKNIGFDPTLGIGQRRPEDKARRVSRSSSVLVNIITDGQAEAIEMLRRPDKAAKLAKPAGMGFSSVKAPAVPTKMKTVLPAAKPLRDDDEDMIDLD